MSYLRNVAGLYGLPGLRSKLRKIDITHERKKFKPIYDYQKNELLVLSGKVNETSDAAIFGSFLEEKNLMQELTWQRLGRMRATKRRNLRANFSAITVVNAESEDSMYVPVRVTIVDWEEPDSTGGDWVGGKLVYGSYLLTCILYRSF